MSDHSHIEWTDATWNPVAGCSLVSPGCTNCYAMRSVAPRLSANPATPHYHGTVKPSKGGPVWTGKIGIASDAVLLKPLSWKRPRRIFVNSTSDLFHEGVPDAVIDRIFAVMASCPQHTFQVLTKRPERMRDYLLSIEREGPGRLRHYLDVTMARSRAARQALVPPMSEPPPPTPQLRALYDRVIALNRNHDIRPDDNHVSGVGFPENHWRPWPLPNVWLGTSVEDQQRADERIPHLLATPAAVRFISAEPLLGPVDLEQVLWQQDYYESGAAHYVDVLRGGFWSTRLGYRASQKGEDKTVFTNHSDMATLDWVIVGGESGSGARPMHPDWARSLRDQCAAAGVPFFLKQWGEWEASLDRDRDDPDWRADYRTNYVDEGRSRWLNLAGDSGFHGERFHVMRRVGKRAAGRLLDGVEHNGMPQVPHG